MTMHFLFFEHGKLQKSLVPKRPGLEQVYVNSWTAREFDLDQTHVGSRPYETGESEAWDKKWASRTDAVQSSSKKSYLNEL
jgi:hypothetical protein